MSLTVVVQVSWKKKALGFLCAVWATSGRVPADAPAELWEKKVVAPCWREMWV